MNMITRIKNKFKRDAKLKEISNKVNEIIAKEPATQFTQDYLDAAIDKAKKSAYERLDTPRERFLFNDVIKEILTHITEDISAYWVPDKKVYHITRKQLDDIAEEHIFNTNAKKTLTGKKYSLDNEKMEICVVFTHRLNGLLAPFSDETEKILEQLKEELLNATH